jgi:hypothetical protein
MVYGRVYSIRSHQTTDIYIGSTTQILCKRMADHRRNYKQYLNKKQHYITSYEIVKYEDAYIELLFEGEFESIDALRKKEGDCQRSMKCVNQLIAGRTPKEHYEENTNLYKKRHQQYYQEHKPQILEQVKKYTVENRDKILEYKKNYRDEHPDDNKQYNIENKETISKRRSTKIKCECGLTICKGAKSNHVKTEKHKRLMLCLSSEENSS